VRWVGLQPDGLRRHGCGSGFSPTGYEAMRMKCVGLKADPQEALPGARCAAPGIAGATDL